MYIFDSNIWIYAFTEQGENPFKWYSKVNDGEIMVAVNPYIYYEVLGGIERSKAVSGPEKDNAYMNFIDFVEQSEWVKNPDREEFYGTDQETYLVEERNRKENHLFRDVFDIQAKDAPILTFAHEWYDVGPTILTNDDKFAKCEPAEFDIEKITVEYVPVDLSKSPLAPVKNRYSSS